MAKQEVCKQLQEPDTAKSHQSVDTQLGGAEKQNAETPLTQKISEFGRIEFGMSELTLCWSD